MFGNLVEREIPTSFSRKKGEGAWVRWGLGGDLLCLSFSQKEVKGLQLITKAITSQGLESPHARAGMITWQ